MIYTPVFKKISSTITENREYLKEIAPRVKTAGATFMPKNSAYDIIRLTIE